MEVNILANKEEMGVKAAQHGAKLMRKIIAEKGGLNMILATGASQMTMIEALLQEPDIAWEKVTVFHLDEYIGLPITHPASFRAYLWERFQRKLPLPLRAFHYLEGDADDTQAECDRLSALIRDYPIDVCFAGFGENAHLAFNDPPADFDTEEAYRIVNLDEACRRQQLGEGWFKSLEEVPKQAISMSVRQIMKSKTIIISCPDERKADAVQKVLEGEVTNLVPASILQEHPDTHVYIDEAAASKLSNR